MVTSLYFNAGLDEPDALGGSSLIFNFGLGLSVSASLPEVTKGWLAVGVQDSILDELSCEEVPVGAFVFDTRLGVVGRGFWRATGLPEGVSSPVTKFELDAGDVLAALVCGCCGKGVVDDDVGGGSSDSFFSMPAFSSSPS